MPENLYPQLPTAPPINQESFNIEMVRRYYQDIANLTTSLATFETLISLSIDDVMPKNFINYRHCTFS